MSGSPPHDVLIDVLTRLPNKTLIRCACVCKSWYSLVTNPSFINTHLNANSNNNNHHLLLTRSLSADDANRVNYSLHWKNDRHNYPYLRIIGSCNGLVCLSDDLHGYREVLYLWNPSIRKTIALPPLRVKFQSHGLFKHSIGIGFDALNDDYKVIRIVYLYKPNNFRPLAEIDIFSLNTGTWRNISHLSLPYTTVEWAPQAYLNGAAHWLAYDGRRKDFYCLIVSFHMGDERFGEIMVPGSFSRENVGVAKFQESLSVIQDLWSKYTSCIWVMKEYGVSDSWTKVFNIDMSVGFGSVVGFTRKGEVLLRLYTGYLVAYDPYTEQKMHLIRGSTFYANDYTESLVLFRAKFAIFTGLNESTHDHLYESSKVSSSLACLLNEVENVD
ncbi:F-box protein At3g07870-like [Cornus florida]|uniref:F-box protein At3g07870-like n=1 Tax=Cornus florida TaxID=4283 RepID=UPI00289D9067|nr:F-box protein At3g07870-like [Cornus florida]